MSPAPSAPTPPAAARGAGPRKRRRRWLRILGAAFVLALVALALMPWWMGWFLAALAPVRGLDFRRYERIGYARFALHDVTFDRAGVRVRLERAEADHPLLWSWRLLAGRAPEIVGTRWEVDVQRPPAPVAPAADRGWMRLRSRLQRTADRLEQWLPRARVGPGTVRWPGGTLAFAGATWGNRALTVTEVGFRSLKAEATLAFGRGADELRLEARDPGAGWAGRWTSRGTALEGGLTWREQVARIEAAFAPSGWLPGSASLRAQDWRLPGEALRLGGTYATIQGSGRVEWREARLTADLTAHGEPQPGREAPPLDLQVRGAGGLEAFQVETLDVTIPGLLARLDAPVTIERSGRVRGDNARFNFRADLAGQPWFAGSGLVEGEVRLAPDLSAAPPVEFEMRARGLRLGAWAVASADAAGRLEWPRLRLTSVVVVPAEGGRLEVTGGVDLSARTVLESRVSGTIRPATVARWVPGSIAFEEATLDAQLSGPFSDVQHGGAASVKGVATRGLKPLAIAAQWRGRGRVVNGFEATATAGVTTLRTSGAVAPDRLRLSLLELERDGVVHLWLGDATEVRWRPEVASEMINLVVAQGGGVDAKFRWGPEGELEIRSDRLSSAWFADLVDLPGPPWDLFEMLGRVTWNRGPAEGALLLSGAAHLSETQSVEVMASLRSEEGGWRIETLRASENGAPIVNAVGRVGLAVRPDEAPLLRLDPDGPLSLQMAATPNAGFWEQLRGLTGVELVEPEATAQLSGTWSRPQGELRVRAARVALDRARFPRPLPALERLELQAVGDTGGIDLRALALQVEGQDVRASGRLDLAQGGWRELWEHPVTVLRRGGGGQIEIPGADLAPFARLAPEYLAAQGRLTASVKFLPGGTWSGELAVADAASRPIGAIGALQEVSARVRFEGNSLELDAATAQLGGQPVLLRGRVDVPAGEAPGFNLMLAAANVPFVRQTGLLVRGDLDLRLQSDPGAAPRLSGTVELRDSLFLADLGSLLSSGPRSGPRRAPYFAVETPALRDWQLAVDVRGVRSLRLRTPLFNGVASARFHLGGTLGSPWATGEATVEQGQVLLPFATFEVTQGHARLTAADPFEPHLLITGATRQYGYDLRMEVTGPASAPALQFSSSPPLTSEQVLLMVMAGNVPREEGQDTKGRRFARLGTYLGQRLLNNLGGDPAAADRITLSTGDNLSRLGRETYNIQYELNRRWAVTGEYDEFDSFNAGVKFRLFSKGGEPADAAP